MNSNSWFTPFRPRFISLKTKFVVFVSLIIIATCSGLSWYFIHNKSEAMRGQLLDMGSILIQNLAHNSRYAVFTEDTQRLTELIDGVLEIEEVVYVVMTGADKNRLVAKSKGRLTGGASLERDPGLPLYPKDGSAETLFKATSSEPTFTTFITQGRSLDIPRNRGKAGTVIVSTTIGREWIYDFAIPIMRRSGGEGQASSLFSQLQGPHLTPESTDRSVYGVIQIGLTEAKMQQALGLVIRNVAWLTIGLIAFSIVGIFILARRITTPLQSLTGLARRVAQGDMRTSLDLRTRDEVGQLAQSFNDMIKALEERNRSISSHIETITIQVNQLRALNQAAGTIASTLDLEKLLSTMLALLIDTLGFTRARLILYDPERCVIYGSRMAGVPEAIEKEWRDITLPVQNDSSFMADVLIRGTPQLIQDVASVAPRMTPYNLDPIRQAGIRSFVCAPLKSQQRILGYLSADKGTRPCDRGDLDLLITLASHFAVAIDNAQAYHRLEEFSHTLEQRVRERTDELQTAYERVREQTDQLREANLRLQELDRLKSAFVSVVSHELRTPMTSIKGYVENLLDGLAGSLTDKQAYYLTRVKHNTERLTRMINDLLDLSKIEAGVIELNPEPLSIRELVTDVVESFHTMAQERSVTLQEQHPPELPVVYADRDKVHRILTNLIQNALKFTQRGGNVWIQTQLVSGTCLQINVADTGCGIAPEELGKIFHRFSRVTSGPPDARGAQLGLAITRGLVELHGGTIWVESTLGRGSCFSFTLPLHASDA